MSKFQRVAIVMLGILPLVLLGGPRAFGQWVPYGPGPRSQHTAVFDPTTNQMIVFGGTDLGTINYNDVWVAVNVISGCSPSCPLNWSFETPGGPVPAARSGHSAVYDSVNSRMIVFGGAEGFPSPCANDVWVLGNANGVGGAPTWAELTPGGGPPAARAGHVATYDPVTNVMMVFGGTDCNGNYLGDFWVLSNANGLTGTPSWTQLMPEGSSPPARAYAAAAYNSSNKTLVIYGGTNGNQLSDVWVLSGANPASGTCTWTQVFPSGNAPPPRYGAASGYDPTTDGLIINSGFSTQGILGDTWVLEDATGAEGDGPPSWLAVATTNAGSQVYLHSGIYSVTNNEFVVFAGISQRAPTPLIADDHVFVLTNANGLSNARK
jgi:hypothetical protein